MWIQVRSFDGKKSKQIDNLSKLTKIEDLRDLLVEHFDAPVDHQRLFFRGKQLVDGHSLFDYGVGLNDLIQLMVRAPLVSPKKADIGASSGDEGSDKENLKPATPEKKPSEEPGTSDLTDSTYKDECRYFTIKGTPLRDAICRRHLIRVGDVIDARDLGMGAWFESTLMKVTKSQDSTTTSNTEKPPKDIKPVLGELVSIKDSNSTDNSQDSSGKKEIKDENANDSAIDSMETDEEASVSSESSSQTKTTDVVSSYDKMFDFIQDDGFVYHLIYEGYEEDDQIQLKCKDVRPRARTNIKFSDVKVGDAVMANYNMEDPDTRGFWYDCVITGKQDTRKVKTLTATVYFGPDLTPLENCKLLFVDEIFACEKAGTQLTAEDLANNPTASPVKRTNKPDCDHCLDNPRKKCRHCACSECGGKNDPDKQIICDECNKAYHIGCMDPPLTSIPEEDEWYCPNCKNDDTEIVKAGEKLKQSKKKAKMASATSTSNRDWGRGMACVGRQKVCNVVPPNHFGPIPGVQVGTMWKFRVGVSEAGVHRPHVAGIHGREDEGAYSIVLSGGYEDDTDNGDSFFYTGSGGRDLSGNKRTAEQSCDQQLTRMNKALAKNCNAPIDNKKGATAKDWRGGKPVRVVRNVKGRKHSDYAPEDGNRYDGIYKIVKYWPEQGKSGFLVWRYMMQRDDPNPAPWSKEGKKKIKELGLTMQYPDGYLEAQAQKEREKEEGEGTPGGKGKKGKGKRKREEEEEEETSSPSKKSKTPKTPKYKVDPAQSKLIKEDSLNQKLWEEALEHTAEGHQKFLQKVEELFTCICCQDIVYKPVTTTCAHNICKSCLQRSFKAEVYCCPACRTDLGKSYEMPHNKILSEILLKFFPGYDAGR